MKIYRHFAENETLRYTFLYTFTPGREEVIQKLKSIEGEGIIIFDTFPEINSETVELEEILSVVTQSGQAMTDTQISEIKSHTNNNAQKWNVLIAQQDRTKLLAEVDRLREKLKSYNEDI